MNYEQKIIEFLENNLSEKSFRLWSGVNKILPNIWNLPTSSTGKYHKKANGEVPSNSEHVYQMLYASKKIIAMFNYSNRSSDTDKLYLAIALHDSLKYGQLGTRKYTDNKHDQQAANMIHENKDSFLKTMNENQFSVLEDCVRFHAGRFSTDAKNQNFSFEKHPVETLIVSVLDMMSTKDLIQTDVRE
jgi:hypothetical protein